MLLEKMNTMQVAEYPRGDDRIVLPLGSVEEHAYLSRATDSILAERVASEAAAPLGVPVFPVVRYGITPNFMKAVLMYTALPLFHDDVLSQGAGEINPLGAFEFTPRFTPTFFQRRIALNDWSFTADVADPFPHQTRIGSETLTRTTRRTSSD